MAGNLEVAAAFWEIADLLELKGENPFKVRAYRRAAERIESLPRDVGDILAEGRLRDIEGIGEAIAKKIEELLTTGKLRYLENLRAEVPRGLVEIMAVPGVGPKTAQALYKALGIATIEELEAAAQAQKIRDIPGMGVKTEQHILRGIELFRSRTARIPLGAVLPVAQDFLERLRRLPRVEEAAFAGSLRRMKETVGDIDVVAASSDVPGVLDAIESFPRVREVLARGQTRIMLTLQEGMRVDVWVVNPRDFTTALHHSTGSKAHNVRLRTIAKEMGLKINEHGVFRQNGEEIPVMSEEDIYRVLGLPYIPPELREDRGEIEAAMEGRLPKLIELGEVKGDLHVHSSWTDGTASIEEMAIAARNRGYQYIAICDHSKSLGVARGLCEEDLFRQIEAIKELNGRLEGIRVLTGIEVDIKKDGSLDYPDSILSQLDVVVASVHSGFRQDEDTMTGRVISALSNEHVDIFAHPTGRLLGRREGYNINLERLFEAAAARKLILEINAFPDRLDLSDVNVRKAKEMGIKFAINTDAHSPQQLEYMAFGVAVARRGWLTAEDVVNALPFEELSFRFIKGAT